MRKILIRFDDICPTMNFEEFDKAIDLMDELDIKPLIGVIPKCEDDILKIDAPKRDFWEYVRNLEKKGYTIAMHGYKHVYDSNKHGMANASNRSEFAGHSFAVQYMKVKKGKEILETKGIHTSIFFAPSHSYDKTTLKVLSKCGFKYISDGMSRVPIERYGIVCIPCRTGGIPVMKMLMSGGWILKIVHMKSLNNFVELIKWKFVLLIFFVNKKYQKRYGIR